MAFELYGLKPRNGIPMPDLPTADEDVKAHGEWLDDVKLDNTKGAYIKIPFFYGVKFGSLLLKSSMEYYQKKKWTIFFIMTHKQ